MLNEQIDRDNKFDFSEHPYSHLPAIRILNPAFLFCFVFVSLCISAIGSRKRLEDSYKILVYYIQEFCFFPQAVSAVIYHIIDPVSDFAESKPVDESIVKHYGRLVFLGDSEWRTAADDGVH